MSDGREKEVEVALARQAAWDDTTGGTTPPTWLDQCAWAAMQGLAGDGWDSVDYVEENADLIAEVAYNVAKAMLNEKRKREGGR